MKKLLKLKACIIEQFETQADFAQALGIDETLVSRIVCGRRVLGSKDRKRWARLLKCKNEDLFK